MEFDLSWILLGLPLAFLLGWLASRLDLRQLRFENRRVPKAYFKGLNFLLNEQQDQAIDAFIEAVQSDPDTSELHFALGNLFRRRGEYDRAVRVHEHLLSRGDISQVDRERAQHALALDFLKAGLLDRAEEALARLEATPFEAQARLALLAIYERSRDWPNAAAITQKMHAAQQGDFSTRQAHYLCEQALALVGRAHRDIPQHLRGPALVFWVFHVLRDYAGTLRDGGSPHVGLLPGLLDDAARLEAAVGPIDLVFGHNDLLPANFLHDGTRLWLIDWDYAGFNSPLFDLGGLAANNGLSVEDEAWMLGSYFGRAPDAALWRAYSDASW